MFKALLLSVSLLFSGISARAQVRPPIARPGAQGAPQGQSTSIHLKNLPPEQLQKLLEVLMLVEHEYKDEVSAAQWEKIVDAMLKACVDCLGDPHTKYYTQNEWKALLESLNGKFVGIGSLVQPHAEGALLDVVFPDSPAAKAGLKNGDVVLAVDGVVSKGKELKKIIEAIKGDPGTEVALTIRRAGAELSFKVKRDSVKVPNLFGRMLNDKVGYIYFGGFEPDTYKELVKEIDSLIAQGAGAIVLDVRDNLGGRLSTVAEITAEFLSKGQQIVTTKKQGKVVGGYKNNVNGDYKGFPLAVLINGSSASASEILAGAVKDHGVGTVIGERSYGKGTVQRLKGFPDGTGVKMTEEEWHTPSDKSIQGQHDPKTGRNKQATGGVVPDINVTVNDDVRAKIREQRFLELFGKPLPGARVKDPVIGKAVETLNPKAEAWKKANPVKDKKDDEVGYFYEKEVGYAWAE